MVHSSRHGADWYLAIILAVVGAVVLLYLGVPRTIAAFVMLPGNEPLRDYGDGKAIDRDQLETIIESRQEALAWVDDGHTWSELALGQLLLAARPEKGGPLDSELVDRAIDSLRSGLTQAPTDTYAWTRLAYAELLARGASQTVSSALVMSMRTGRYQPQLTLFRLKLCLAVWPHFAVKDYLLVLDQVRLAWRRWRKDVVEIARATGRPDVIRAALAQTPRDLAEFERRLGRSGS